VSDAASLAKLLKPSEARHTKLDWLSALSVADYESVFGTASRSTVSSLPAWTEVGGLEDLYTQVRGKLVAGPLLQTVLSLSRNEKLSILSLVVDALNARSSTAFSSFGGRMNRARTFTWLLLRHAQSGLQSHIEGLPPDTSNSTASGSLVTVRMPSSAVTGRLSVATSSDGE